MSSVSSQINLNDSEIVEIEKVLAALGRKQGTNVDVDAFVREVTQRFEDIRLEVDVKVFRTDHIGTYAFDIDITKRLEGAFDYEKMRWEVTNDVLGISEPGVLKDGKLKGV